LLHAHNEERVLLLCRAASDRMAAFVGDWHETSSARGAAVLVACWREWQMHGPAFGDAQMERHSVDIGLSALHAIAPGLRQLPLTDDLALWLSDEMDSWWSTVRGYRAGAF
jgi:hypothetical protein